MSTFNESNIVSITEKLASATANVEKVFRSGEEQGYSEGYLNGLCAGGHLDGYQAGKKEEYDAFWDALQNKGQRTNYMYGFAFWNAEKFHPKYKIVPTEQSRNIFHTFRGIKKLEAKYIDLSQVPRGTYDGVSMSYAFYDCLELEEIEDIGLMPSYSYYAAFSNDSKLKKIAKITVDRETILKAIFNYCQSLEEVFFDGEIGDDIDLHWSKGLKWSSIANIVTHLSDSVTGKTLTLSKTAVESTGTDMQSWYEFTWMKPNWTITLA